MARVPSAPTAISFEVPDGWLDKTVVAFAAPPMPDVPRDYLPNVVVTREPLAERESLRTHADRTLLEMAKVLESFDILESRETTLGGLPAVHVRFCWTSRIGPVEQTLTMCESPCEPGDTSRFATLVTTSSHATIAARAKPLFDALLQTFRFGQAHAAPPPPVAFRQLPPDPRFSSGPMFGVSRR